MFEFLTAALPIAGEAGKTAMGGSRPAVSGGGSRTDYDTITVNIGANPNAGLMAGLGLPPEVQKLAPVLLLGAAVAFLVKRKRKGKK